MNILSVIYKIQNFILHVIVFTLGIFITSWLTGVLVAYIVSNMTNDFYKIGINLLPINILYTWLNWMILYWSKLPFSAYNYLKLKLTLSSVIPITIFLGCYIKNFSKIKRFQFIGRRETIYGDSHWASQEEVEAAGLRSKHGMLLGKDEGGYYIADGFQHALLFAPTGSGKGVGFVIPNLLFWEHSIVVHDIKLENYELTSGWRSKMGQAVYVWEPANPDGITHCYNPIDWVSSKPGQMVDDVQKIANLILPEKDFWNNEARSLFLGVVLYLIADNTKVKSFGEVVRTMRSDDVTYNLAVVLDTLGRVIHPVAYMNISAFLQKADKERSGVISTMNSGLELWANPLIDAATASSDFNILEFKRKATTIYIGLTPDNINRLQKLMQVFYQQATEFLSRKMPNIKEEPYGVMFLMDEFPTLGKMDQFKSGIAYFRGYRVRLFLIIQDTQQLKGTYEEAGMNSFLSNSTFRITFAANNYETANLISQLCGNKTVQQASHSKPTFFDLNPSTRTMNVSEVQRALLLPQEVIQLPRDDQIILIESCPPMKSKKIKYFQDKFFTSRLLPPVFVPTQKPFEINKEEENPANPDTSTENKENKETIEDVNEDIDSEDTDTEDTDTEDIDTEDTDTEDTDNEDADTDSKDTKDTDIKETTKIEDTTQNKDKKNLDDSSKDKNDSSKKPKRRKK